MRVARVANEDLKWVCYKRSILIQDNEIRFGLVKCSSGSYLPVTTSALWS